MTPEVIIRSIELLVQGGILIFMFKWGRAVTMLEHVIEKQKETDKALAVHVGHDDMKFNEISHSLTDIKVSVARLTK